MLKLKFQHFGHLMWGARLIRKGPDAGKDWRQEEKGTTEDEMVGWHHWLNGHECEQVPGVGEEQGSLACCSPQGHKESEWLNDWMTEWLNDINKKGPGNAWGTDQAQILGPMLSAHPPHPFQERESGERQTMTHLAPLPVFINKVLLKMIRFSSLDLQMSQSKSREDNWLVKGHADN